MALHGTIQDFALPDIFQLIGIQRKTGVLTLDDGKDAVTIKFLEGNVVGADTRNESIEDRLGEVLVRTGLITPADLDAALEVQKNTLQRLGHILVKNDTISEEELIEALKIQSTQIIYRLFRWREGSYGFDKVDDLDYDQSHFVPISAETILMEGARMVDEWPIIERRIPNDKIVLRKRAAAEEIQPEDVEAVVDDLDLDLDLALGGDPDPEPQPSRPDKPKISAEEREVLALVDGKRNVREIADLLNLGEFDTFRILSDLMTRSLLERVEQRPATARATSGSGIGSKLLLWMAQLTLAAGALASLLTLPSSDWTPWQMLGRSEPTDQLRLYASMARLEKLEKAIRVFYLDTGRFPATTPELAEGGYLRTADLLDPWGRPYQLQVSGGGYQLYGFDRGGDTAPQLMVSRRFSPVQSMMVGGSEEGDTDR